MLGQSNTQLHVEINGHKPWHQKTFLILRNIFTILSAKKKDKQLITLMPQEDRSYTKKLQLLSDFNTT
jgi:hypothetical protein